MKYFASGERKKINPNKIKMKHKTKFTKLRLTATAMINFEFH